MRLMLDVGFDANVRDASNEHGYTPLHSAASVEVARLLIDAGADPTARDTRVTSGARQPRRAPSPRQVSLAETGRFLAAPNRPTIDGWLAPVI